MIPDVSLYIATYRKFQGPRLMMMSRCDMRYTVKSVIRPVALADVWILVNKHVTIKETPWLELRNAWKFGYSLSKYLGFKNVSIQSKSNPWKLARRRSTRMRFLRYEFKVTCKESRWKDICMHTWRDVWGMWALQYDPQALRWGRFSVSVLW